MKRQRYLDFAENARKWVARRAINSDGLYLTNGTAPGRTRAARRPIEGVSIASADLGDSGESCANSGPFTARIRRSRSSPCLNTARGTAAWRQARAAFVEARHDERCLHRRRPLFSRDRIRHRAPSRAPRPPRPQPIPSPFCFGEAQGQRQPAGAGRLTGLADGRLCTPGPSDWAKRSAVACIRAQRYSQPGSGGLCQSGEDGRREAAEWRSKALSLHSSCARRRNVGFATNS